MNFAPYLDYEIVRVCVCVCVQHLATPEHKIFRVKKSIYAIINMLSLLLYLFSRWPTCLNESSFHSLMTTIKMLQNKSSDPRQ